MQVDGNLSISDNNALGKKNKKKPRKTESNDMNDILPLNPSFRVKVGPVLLCAGGLQGYQDDK